MADGKQSPQAEKFQQVARDLECDEDEKAFEDKLMLVAKAKEAAVAKGKDK